MKTMKSVILTTLVLLCWGCTMVLAQNPVPDSIMFANYDSAMFRKTYKLANEIQAEAAKYNDNRGAAVAFGQIGDYENCLKYWDKEEYGDYVFPKEDSLEFLRYVPEYATDYILERARTEQVIMINEATHNPMHRAYILSLLQGLYDRGFRYLASEGLSFYDENVYRRGYPLKQSISGRYTDEPLAGDIVRTALKLGFIIVPYDKVEAGCTQKYSRDECRQKREDNQANNIASLLKENPNAKILVHASYGHIDERANAKVPMMAARFKTFTGIDPFTIDQEFMTEHSENKYEYPIYTLAADLFQIKSPSYFASEDTMYNLNKDYCDLLVFHPRTKIENERPLWMKLGGQRTNFPMDLNGLKSGKEYLVQAFPVGEDTFFGVPIDQFEVTDPKRPHDLMLPYGDFVIRVLNRDAEVVKEFEITIARN